MLTYLREALFSRLVHRRDGKNIRFIQNGPDVVEHELSHGAAFSENFIVMVFRQFFPQLLDFLRSG